MSRKGRRIAYLLIAVLAAVVLVSVAATAEETTQAPWKKSGIRKDETGKWAYSVLEDGTAVITGFAIEGTSLTIPDEIDGIPVSMVARASVEKSDYAKMRAVKKVTLPAGLKVIGQQAFEFFSAMTSINIPKGLEAIEYAAFRECKALKSITIPEGIESIGDEAFSKCSSLVFPKLPSTVARIGDRAFYQCLKIGNVKLPGSVRSVGAYAFASCQLGSLTLEEGLEQIGEGAFYSHKLKDIKLPASLKSIGNKAFDPNINKGLRKVTFSSASVQIGTGVFGYDDGWSRFYRKIQNGETDLKKEDFDKNDPENWIDYYRDSDNFGQETLTITCYPGSAADQLYQHHVTKVYLKGSTENTVTAQTDRVFRAGQYTNADMVYELVIPEGVEELEDGAFAGLETLNRITLPASLTKIGAHAFDGCTGLREVVIQAKTMTGIGEAAFMGCTELKSIVIPDGITEIADSTFDQCRKLEKVKMPRAGVLRIGKKAFADCKAVSELKLNPGLESIGTEAFKGCGVKSLQIPDSVTSIGHRAFYLSGLKSLKLPAAMEEITDYLCAYSVNLAQVTLPKSLKRIGKCAFMRCPVGSLALPEGLESIGERAFAFDPEDANAMYGKKKMISKLRGITIPSTLKVIGQEAFIANDALTAVKFAKNSRISEIGDSAFAYCFRLKSISLPDSLQKAGNQVFLRCKEMTSADLGQGIADLGDEAFKYCIRMTKLTVPDTLKKIGKDILKEHSRKLKVTTPFNSAMQIYLRKNCPDVQIVNPKKK